MFRAEKRFVSETGEEKALVVDDERGLILRSVARETPEAEFNVYLLSWSSGRVPVEGYYRERQDATTGETFYELTLGGIGENTRARFREGIVADFGSPRVPIEQLRLWAFEALLAYGGYGEGLNRPDGYNRVILHGKQCRLSDFGPYDLPQQLNNA